MFTDADLSEAESEEFEIIEAPESATAAEDQPEAAPNIIECFVFEGDRWVSKEVSHPHKIFSQLY